MKFKIKVHPNYSIDRVEQVSKEALEVYVKDKPDKNKANLKIIKLVSKHFKVPASRIKLKGLKSKTKFIEVINANNKI